MSRNKMKIIVLIIIALLPIGCKPQSNVGAVSGCNRSVYVQAYLKRLPSEICLPKGYRVMMIHNKVDLTNDDIPELVIKLDKQNATDGDTSLLYVYRKNTKGIYEIFKTLHNVYPLYLSPIA
jgi:hypothetical protein